ncbi:hypothetical protein BsIDN1_00840 [Bacillus safensis]|uniref:Uncharacterized protein n=1 Tax=Bacillus safensis TaxID=561879 RepID=A0A5S9M4N6_BACIA|nr:hypothetical protein BsIDN1_00840 [Bacillus safensis]
MFPRLEVEEEVSYIKKKMQGSAPKVEEEKVEIEETELPELGAEIAFDDFSKVDLRVAQVLEAAPVKKKADRLLKLQLDFGFEKKTNSLWDCQALSTRGISREEACLRSLILHQLNSEGNFPGNDFNWRNWREIAGS